MPQTSVRHPIITAVTNNKGDAWSLLTITITRTTYLQHVPTMEIMKDTLVGIGTILTQK